MSKMFLAHCFGKTSEITEKNIVKETKRRNATEKSQYK